ncbi:hypothetical protein BIU89_07940 [Curtobacterium sp. MCBA15_005]|nr:hypothetical protein BIU89_07940 [Curtobacterium sp. MCBA15_005]
MSEHTELIVALDIAERDQRRMAADVNDWLRASGWSVRSASANGPDALGAHADSFRESTWSSAPSSAILCSVEDSMWDAVSDMEGPRCWQCDSEIADEDVSHLGDWMSGPEPVFTCGQCGAVALAGDMNVASSVVFGNPGITIECFGYDGIALARRLLTEVRGSFANRWAYVHRQR